MKSHLWGWLLCLLVTVRRIFPFLKVVNKKIKSKKTKQNKTETKSKREHRRTKLSADEQGHFGRRPVQGQKVRQPEGPLLDWGGDQCRSAHLLLCTAGHRSCSLYYRDILKHDDKGTPKHQLRERAGNWPKTELSQGATAESRYSNTIYWGLQNVQNNWIHSDSPLHYQYHIILPLGKAPF